MKKVALSLTAILFLTLSAPVLMSAQAREKYPPHYSQELPIVSDEARNCLYGIRPVTSDDYAAPGTIKGLDDLRIEAETQGPCDVSFGWAPKELSIDRAPFVYVSQSTNMDPNQNQHLCDGASDPTCSASKWSGGNLWASSTLYKCESDQDLNCVASLEVTAPDGKVQKARFKQLFPEVKVLEESWWNVVDIARNPYRMGYPKGAGSPLWEFDGPNGVVTIATAGNMERTFQSNGISWENPSAMILFGLMPVKVITNSPGSTKPVARESLRDIGNGKTATVVRSDPVDPTPAPECARRIAMDTNSCLLAESFPEGYRFKISMQLPNDVTLYLNARLDAPIVYTEPIKFGTRIIIDAAPQNSYVVGGSIPKAVMAKEFTDYIKKNMYWAPQMFRSPADIPPMENRFKEILNLALPYLGDYARYISTAWTFKSSNSLGSVDPRCSGQFKGQILGITSSNATAYDDGPPSFDKLTRTISYEVAAPHFTTDGKTEAIGRYYININSKFVQCLFGIEKVPEVATLGITYGANAEKSISTVTVHTDKDWLRMVADNFHFSAPKINIVFPKESAPTTVVKKPTVKRTITCVKGKVVKKVSGSSPKCPTGYKIK